MINKYIKSSQKLLPILALFLIAACGGKEPIAIEDVEQQAFDDLRAKIESVIPDPERQSIIIGLVDEVHVDYSELREAVVIRRAELRKLNADYDATREQFAAYIEKYDARIKLSREKVSASHQKLIRATTVEEWDALKKADTKTMKKLISSLQAI